MMQLQVIIYTILQLEMLLGDALKAFDVKMQVSRYYKQVFHLCADLIRGRRKYNKTCLPFEELLLDKYKVVKIVINSCSSLAWTVRCWK